MRAVVATVTTALAAWSSGCDELKKAAGAKGECLSLPAASRTHLIADPENQTLYWLEEVRRYSYEAELLTHLVLVRYDIRERERQVVVEEVAGPLYTIDGNPLVLRRNGQRWVLIVVDRDNDHIQELTPDYLDVTDVELIDDRSIAVIADGDGARSVYIVDLDRPRVHRLIDADVLLSTFGGRVFVVSDGNGIAIDIETGHRESFSWVNGHLPRGPDAIFVDDSVVRARAMTGGEVRTLIEDKRRWSLDHQWGSVLARTPVNDNRSHAHLLSTTGDVKLPLVHGGASIVAATKLRDDIWALIGHNTANYLGDLATSHPEVDVCRLPKQERVEYATRSVPARFASIEAKFFDAVSEAAPNAGVQLKDDGREPTTVYLYLQEPGGNAFAAMRTRARELHQRVSALLGDREVRTEIRFEDGRTAVVRWRRSRLRDRTFAGMGDALLSDPAEFDLELRDRVLKIEGDKVRCAGVLIPTTGVTWANLEVRCVGGDRERVIPVPEVTASGHRFDATFEKQDNDWLYLEVYQNEDPLGVYDLVFERKQQRIFEIAAAAYARSTLSFTHYVVKNDQLDIVLEAPRDFTGRTSDARSLAASRAYLHFEELRDVLELERTVPMRIRITVPLSEVEYEYDGTTLTVDD